MLFLILGGLLVILLTTLTHSLLTRIVIYRVSKELESGSKNKIWLINRIILLNVIFTITESLYWASYYFAIDAFSTFEDAVYFSLVTFSTLGYGDLVLSNQHRILGGLEAANGIIIFGWTTAIVIAVIQRLYIKKKDSE